MSQPSESPFTQGQILILATEEQNYAFDLWETFRVALGRHHTNDIPLGSRKVSNYHAEILNEPDGLRIRDLGSTNGTFVNDEQVKSRELKEGDLVRIGGYEMTVKLEKREGSGDGPNVLPVGAKGALVTLRAQPRGNAPSSSADERALPLDLRRERPRGGKLRRGLREGGALGEHRGGPRDRPGTRPLLVTEGGLGRPGRAVGRAEAVRRAGSPCGDRVGWVPGPA